MVLRNQNGVVMHVHSTTRGARLQLGTSGLSIKLNSSDSAESSAACNRSGKVVRLNRAGRASAADSFRDGTGSQGRRTILAGRLLFVQTSKSMSFALRAGLPNVAGVENGIVECWKKQS